MHATLLHPLPKEKRFHGLLNKLLFIQETRFKEGGLNIYRDIGVYECDCGFSYHVMNCGMTMVKTKCPDCKKEIGGQSHKHVDRAGHIHYSKMEALVERIKNLQKQCVKEYKVHNVLPYNDDEYKSYDILEGEVPRTERILKHLLDHAYLLIMPYLVGDKNQEAKKKLKAFFDGNKEFKEVYKKMNNIRLRDYIDYFMAHVMFDAEMIGANLNINYKDSITLVNETLTILAENMDSGINLSASIGNNVPMIYNDPKRRLLAI